MSVTGDSTKGSIPPFPTTIEAVFIMLVFQQSYYTWETSPYLSILIIIVGIACVAGIAALARNVLRNSAKDDTDKYIELDHDAQPRRGFEINERPNKRVTFNHLPDSIVRYADPLSKENDVVDNQILDPHIPINNDVPSVSISVIEPDLASDPYIHLFPPLASEFLTMADTVAEPSLPELSASYKWHTIVSTRTGNFSIEIQKRVDAEFCFRHVVEMEATKEQAFDYLSNVETRPVWDEMCEAGGVLERVSRRTTIQTFRTKGMWPTSPREALVASFIKLLPDGRLLNVTQSIPSHPLHHPPKNAVRMTARIAGQIVSPDPLGRAHMCRVVQVIDGDLGGWLPAGVVGLVTTKAIPAGMAKANELLKSSGVHAIVSEAITRAEKVVNGIMHEGGRRENPAGPHPSKPSLMADQLPPPHMKSSTQRVVKPDNGALMARSVLLPVVRSRSRMEIMLRFLKKVQPWFFVTLVIAFFARRWQKR